MNIELHVERLVLDGLELSRVEAAGVQSGLEAELTRLLQSGGLSPDLSREGSVPGLPASRIEMPKQPQSFGAEIARTVHARLGDGHTPKGGS